MSIGQQYQKRLKSPSWYLILYSIKLSFRLIILRQGLNHTEQFHKQYHRKTFKLQLPYRSLTCCITCLPSNQDVFGKYSLYQPCGYVFISNWAWQSSRCRAFTTYMSRVWESSSEFCFKGRESPLFLRHVKLQCKCSFTGTETGIFEYFPVDRSVY